MTDVTDGKYKDESPEFLKGSNVAEGRPTGEMNGAGLESTSPEFVKEKGSQAWQKGADKHE